MTITHEITATSYGSSHSGKVDFTLELPKDTDNETIEKIARERAETELRDSGYRTGPFTLEIDGEDVDDKPGKYECQECGGKMSLQEPSTTATRRVNVNFSAETYETISRIAARKGVTMSEVLRQAIALEDFVEQARVDGARVLVDRKGQINELVLR